MGPRPNDSAAKTMNRFKKAGIGFAATAGMAYAPGDIVYTGSSVGRGAGHVQVIDSKGRFNDQYGPHARPKTRPEWVVRAGGAASPAAADVPTITPPGFKSKIEDAKKLLDLDPSKLDGKKLDEILSKGFDGTLSKFTAVPKAWGAAVRDTEGTTARFALQTRLASSEFQSDLEMTAALTGKTVPQIVAWLRKLANAADFKLGAVGLSRDFEKLASATRTGRGEVSQKVGALRDAAPLIQSPNFSQAAYERTLAASQLKRGAWASEDVVKQFAAMKTMERGGDLKGAHALSTRLNRQVNERIGSAQLGDDAARLQAAQVAYGSLMQTQRDELALLDYENRLLFANGKSREEIERALVVETARRKALAGLMAGKPTASKSEVEGFKTQAAASGVLEGQKFDASKAGGRTKEAKDFNLETARSIELLKAQARAYAHFSAGSPALSLELKRLEIRNGLMAQPKFADKSKNGLPSSLPAPLLKDFNSRVEDHRSYAVESVHLGFVLALLMACLMGVSLASYQLSPLLCRLASRRRKARSARSRWFFCPVALCT